MAAVVITTAFASVSFTEEASAKSLPCWSMQGNNPQHTAQSSGAGPVHKAGHKMGDTRHAVGFSLHNHGWNLSL